MPGRSSVAGAETGVGAEPGPGALVPRAEAEDTGARPDLRLDLRVDLRLDWAVRNAPVVPPRAARPGEGAALGEEGRPPAREALLPAGPLAARPGPAPRLSAPAEPELRSGPRLEAKRTAAPAEGLRRHGPDAAEVLHLRLRRLPRQGTG